MFCQNLLLDKVSWWLHKNWLVNSIFWFCTALLRILDHPLVTPWKDISNFFYIKKCNVNLFLQFSIWILTVEWMHKGKQFRHQYTQEKTFLCLYCRKIFIRNYRKSIASCCLPFLRPVVYQFLLRCLHCQINVFR